MNKWTGLKIGFGIAIAAIAVYSIVSPMGDPGGPGGPNLLSILEGGGRADIGHRILDGAVGGWGN